MPNIIEVSRYKRFLINLRKHYQIIHANPFGRIGFWVIAIFLFVGIFSKMYSQIFENGLCFRTEQLSAVSAKC